jgi:type II secretory pathway pseudopilin PulG
MRNSQVRLSALGFRLWAFRTEGGLSLVEATVILGVVSMLTAVLAPSVRSYVQTAQQAAAKKDVEVIGSALARMLTDVGELWVSRDGNGASATAPPSHAAGNRVDLLVSDGRVPAKYLARSSGSPDWDTAVNDTTVQKLEYFLVTNTPSNTSANAYRTATNMSVVSQFDPDDGATFNSPHGWRGAYLPGPIGADPWGNRYAVNVEYLARGLGAGPSGNVNDVFVISAGSNGLIETRYDIDGASSGNDVIYVVSGGTR